MKPNMPCTDLPAYLKVILRRIVVHWDACDTHESSQIIDPDVSRARKLADIVCTSLSSLTWKIALPMLRLLLLWVQKRTELLR